jgi:hypothetical protein
LLSKRVQYLISPSVDFFFSNRYHVASSKQSVVRITSLKFQLCKPIDSDVLDFYCPCRNLEVYLVSFCYQHELIKREESKGAFGRACCVRTLRCRNSFCTSDAGTCGQHRRTHLMAVALEFVPSPPSWPREMALPAALVSSGAKGGSSTHRFLFPSLATSRAACPAAVDRLAAHCSRGFDARRRRKRSAAVLIAIKPRLMASDPSALS